MNTPLRAVFLFFLVVLFGPALITAQTRPSQDTDLLRSKIEQLEKTDVSTRSAMVRDVYRRTLIRLYSEFDQALQEDIGELRKIQSIASGSNADPRDDISLQIQKLANEQAANAEKLKTLQNGTELAGSAKPSNAAPPANSNERVSAPASGDRLTVSIPSTPEASVSAPPQTGATDTNPNPVVVVCTDSNGYPNVPELVSNEVDKLAGNLVDNVNDLSLLGQNYPTVFLYAVADAIIPDAENTDRSIRQLKAYRYLAETARTDKQIGASARSAGSTSAIEKPGFARILGLAVERGAILQDVSSSSLTLSTSPYVLYTFNNGGDTAQNYARAGFLNRLGLSATFNIGDSNSAVLANAKRSQLSEWSARLRLFGDRSTRSAGFERFWDKEIVPHIQARLTVIANNLSVVGATPELKRLKDNDQKELKKMLAERIKQSDYQAAITAKDTEKQKKILTEFVLCYIKQAVVDPVRNNKILLSSEIRTQLGTTFIRDLGQSLTGLELARKKLNEKLDDLSKSPLATFAYTNHRVPTSSDYSELKFLYEQDQSIFRLLKLVGNVGVSLYNKPNATLNQERIRDFSASLSLEGKTNSPFLRQVPDLSKITFAFTGSYQRMPENRGVAGKTVNLGAAQFKLDIPIIAGFTLPFSVTYANGTEQSNRAHVRTNFGFAFDMDKVIALTRLLQSQQ